MIHQTFSLRECISCWSYHCSVGVTTGATFHYSVIFLHQGKVVKYQETKEKKVKMVVKISRQSTGLQDTLAWIIIYSTVNQR